MIYKVANWERPFCKGASRFSCLRRRLFVVLHESPTVKGWVGGTEGGGGRGEIKRKSSISDVVQNMAASGTVCTAKQQENKHVFEKVALWSPFSVPQMTLKTPPGLGAFYN